MARIDDLMDTVDSKFHLVHLAAKRARDIGWAADLIPTLNNMETPQ